MTEFDSAGDQVKFISYYEDGSRTEYEFDGPRVPTKAADYDSAGKLTMITYFNAEGGTYATYEYDSAGNMVKDTFYNNPDGSISSSTEYNSDGKMVRYTYYDSDDGTYGVVEYDSDEKPVKTTVYNADDSIHSVRINEYDNAGKRVKCTEYFFEDNIVQRWVEYEIDSEGPSSCCVTILIPRSKLRGI